MQENGFPADGDIPTAAAGWAVGEITVEVLKEAAAVAGRPHPGLDHGRRPEFHVPPDARTAWAST